MDGVLAVTPFAMREADMAEATARISSEIDGRRSAARRVASPAGVVVIAAAALLGGANLLSRPDWVSQAQIRGRPAGFADVVDKVKPAVLGSSQIGSRQAWQGDVATLQGFVFG